MSHRVLQTMPLLIWAPFSLAPTLVHGPASPLSSPLLPFPNHTSLRPLECRSTRGYCMETLCCVYTQLYFFMCLYDFVSIPLRGKYGCRKPRRVCAWDVISNYLLTLQTGEPRSGQLSRFHKQLNSEFCSPLPQYNPINLLKQVTDLPISALYTTSPLLPSLLCLPFQLRMPQVCVVLLITLTHVFNSLNFFL